MKLRVLLHREIVSGCVANRAARLQVGLFTSDIDRHATGITLPWYRIRSSPPLVGGKPDEIGRNCVLENPSGVVACELE